MSRFYAIASRIAGSAFVLAVIASIITKTHYVG
jgi:hypothetical protein